MFLAQQWDNRRLSPQDEAYPKASIRAFATLSATACVSSSSADTSISLKKMGSTMFFEGLFQRQNVPLLSASHST